MNRGDRGSCPYRELTLHTLIQNQFAIGQEFAACSYNGGRIALFSLKASGNMIARIVFHWFLTFIWIGALAASLCAGQLAHAQPLSPVVVLATAVQDRGEKLGLDVLFTLRDSQGQPIANADIEGATLRLVDEQRPPELAQWVGQAETPIYIVMLIDTSGSMSGALEAVKSAARSAINSAPPNARIAVYGFSDASRLIADYAADGFRVQDAISSIADTSGNTCLYDAVYAALEDLDRVRSAQDSSARTSVIIFTDGKDERIETGGPCSVRTESDVTQRARELSIPVNTIGMNDDPTRIDRQALQRLAEATGAYSATGDQSQLNRLFQHIFNGLNSQYAASFETYARPGVNRALIEVTLRGRPNSLLSAPFSFFSPRAFTEPTPTPPPSPTRVPPTPVPPTPTLPPAPTSIPFFELSGIIQDADRFTALVTIDRPAEVKFLLLTVETDGGENLFIDKAITVDGNSPVPLEIDKNILASGREYKVIIKAVDNAGNQILRIDEISRSQTTTLLEKSFKYEQPTPVPIVAFVQGITVDLQNKLLTIILDTTQPRLLDDFMGTISEVETGLEVDDFGPSVFPTQFDPFADRVTIPLNIPLPAALMKPTSSERAEEGVEYRLALKLITKDDQTIDLEPFAFRIDLPPAPGVLEIIWTTLTRSPIYLAVIFAAVMSLALWLLLARGGKRPAYRLSQSPEEYTVIGGTSKSSGKRVRLVIQVRETPTPAEKKERIVSSFPCTIGRSSSCQLRFGGDSQISRRHAEIRLLDGEFSIVDLGSDNGTQVDGASLAAHIPHTLADGQSVRIGRRTTFDVRIQYAS